MKNLESSKTQQDYVDIAPFVSNWVMEGIM